MGKISKVLFGISVVLILGAAVTGTVFSIINYNKVIDIEKSIKAYRYNDESNIWDDGDLNEDDPENVLIGEEYMILSTKNISDAYLSGDESKLSGEDKTTLKVARELLEDIIDEDMSDYEKEEAVYVWMCENIKNDETGLVAVPEAAGITDRPYGVLQNKQAVCVGYATTFRLLLNMLGMDCMVMHDDGYSHSWNLVQLDDGCWYIVDCYFDAGDDSPRYRHFNMTQQLALCDHSWDETLYPVANGTEYSYAYNNKTAVAGITDLLEELKKAYENRETSAFFELAYSPEAEDSLYYISEGIMMRLQDQDVYAEISPYMEDEEHIMVMYSYEDYGSSMPGQDNPDVNYDEIDRQLDEIYGEISDYFSGYGNLWGSGTEEGMMTGKNGVKGDEE